MKTFAEYQIIGRVGRIIPAGPTLKVSVGADYGRKNDDGTWESKMFWNTITVFNENMIRWARSSLGTGDLIHVRGTIREVSYDKDGETRYGVSLSVDQLDLLAKKQNAA